MKDLLKKECASSTDKLKKIERKTWKGVTPKYFQKLYESMLRRMQAVVEANGGHIKYYKLSIIKSSTILVNK